MKEEEIKIRISDTLKKDFQEICENEQTTMSNKINTFIFDEVKLKKPIKETYRKKLIKLGVVNNNGRLYTKDELIKTKFNEDGFEYTELDKLSKTIYYGQFGYGSEDNIIHKYNATHSISNISINEDWVEGDVTILNKSITPILDNLVFRPRSYGRINEQGVIYELEIIGFDAILKSEDSFNL